MKYIVEKASDEQLLQILAESAKYKESFLLKVKKEIEIRKKLDKFSDKVTALSDEELAAKLNDQAINESFLRACQLESMKREEKRKEEAKKEAARLEAERQQILKEKKEKSEAQMKALLNTVEKYKFYIGGAIVVVLILGLYLYNTSSGVRFKDGMKYYEAGKMSDAIGKLSKVSRSSDHYVDAQLTLSQIYGKKEAAKSAIALQNAARSTKPNEKAVEMYTHALLTGSLSPHIAKDSLVAATYYYDHQSLLPDGYNRAGSIYFHIGKFDLARSCFEKASVLTAYGSGCLGMMYMYGWGGLEHDYKAAEKYLSDSDEHTPMFYVAAGDLILYQEYGKRSTSPKKFIERANEKYEMAASLEPNNESYVLRAKITGEWLKAYKHTKRYSYYGQNKVIWDSYFYGNNSGHYEGRMDETAPIGWGCFTHKSNDICLGYMKTISPNVYVTGLGIIVAKTTRGDNLLYLGKWSNKQNNLDGFFINSEGLLVHGKIVNYSVKKSDYQYLVNHISTPDK